jgi:hypothetical protein
VGGLFDKFSFRVDLLKKEYAQAEFFVIDISIGLKAGNNGERLSDLEALRILEAWKPGSSESSPNLEGKQCMRNATEKHVMSMKDSHEKGS